MTRKPSGDLNRRQRDAFTQRPGEDNYVFIVRTMRTLRYRDLPHLMMIRAGDNVQIDAVRLYVELKMVKWTRALAFGTVILGVCTIVAAFIAQS